MQQTDAWTDAEPMGQVQEGERLASVDASSFSFFQLWNMNVGFLGIQFGWGLQMANMSAIYEHLGASAHAIPILWLAAPLTGLVVQPIVGNLSDYTWGVLGRRRPYLLVGALCASVALVLMPSSSTLWMAAGLLWILDTSANVSMVPFRALVGDLLPEEQRTRGFAMQSIMVGMGAIAASIMPWLLNHLFKVDSVTHALRRIPLTVELSFYLGAVLFLGTILWTIATTPERPPEDWAHFSQLKASHGGVLNSLKAVRLALGEMPRTMKQLAWVQGLTWLGIFCFFLYFPTAVACNIFGATALDSVRYSEGIEWAGLCFAVFNAVCVVFSFGLPALTRWIGHRAVHGFCLASGGLSLVLLQWVQHPLGLLPLMIGFGLTWASVLSMPYAMLSQAIPTDQQGIYQGIFNLFVVLPQIFISLGFGWIMEHWLGDNRLTAVVLGGVFLLLAAAVTGALNLETETTSASCPAD